MLKKLEAKNYICRERSKEDERLMKIYLTKEGVDVRRKLPEVSCQVMKQSNISERICTTEKCTSRYRLQRLENKR